MRAALTVLLICSLAASGYAQGVNQDYGAGVAIVFHAPNGRVPPDAKLTPPAYPSGLHRAGISGEVTFEITVQENGDVTGVVVNGAQEEFRRVAKDALASWKFLPRRKEVSESPRPLLLAGKIRFTIIEE